MDKSLSRTLNVQVVYATPQRQEIMSLQVPAGCTALQAVQQSGITQRFPEIHLAQAVLGIFGQRINSDQILEAGDRIEIYRPLLMDPKESRRQRARAASKQRGSKAP